MGWIKESIHGSDKVSSKRILMYVFSAVIIGCIVAEVVYRFIALLDHFATTETGDCGQVTPDVVYYSVFALIFGLAGINGVQKTWGKNEPEQENDIDGPGSAE